MFALESLEMVSYLSGHLDQQIMQAFKAGNRQRSF